MTYLKVPATEHQAHHINQERARIVRTLAGTAARSARSAASLTCARNFDSCADGALEIPGNCPAYPREAGALSRRARAAMPVSLTASTPRRRAGAPQQRGSHRHPPRWLLPVLLLSLGSVLSLGLSLATAGSVRAVARPDGPDKRSPEAEASSFLWSPLGIWKVTAYCPCATCCGRWADPSTVLRAGGRVFADGSPVEGQSLRAVAAPRGIPFGAELYIEGLGPVTVRDRGGAIKGKRIDLFHATHEGALRWGVQSRRVWILRRR